MTRLARNPSATQQANRGTAVHARDPRGSDGGATAHVNSSDS